MKRVSKMKVQALSNPGSIHALVCMATLFFAGNKVRKNQTRVLTMQTYRTEIRSH